MNISERPLDDEMIETIEESLSIATQLLDIDGEHTPPLEVVTRLDRYVCTLQSDPDSDSLNFEELSLQLGSLWGRQLERALQWQWASVVFDQREEAQAVGVFSQDRRLAIYPFHFIFACLDQKTPVTILLAFTVLHDPKRIPALPDGAYENVMDNVHQ
jgi:hypothetical protein